MKHTHYVAFQTTLPDDIVTEEDGFIIDHGGETVTKTVVEIIEQLGGNRCRIWSEGELGWQADGKYKSAFFWLQTSNIDYFFLTIESLTHGSLFRSAPPPIDFNELLVKLSDALKSDMRFSDLQWSRNFDFDDKRGSDSPILEP